MLELYQFELSAYCEKVRLILDYKGLAYKKRDVVPGVGQLDLFRLSGQRQVPVLKDGDTYIADSTEIAFYLDRKYPEKPIIPTDPLQRGQCLLIEEWADESLGLKGRTAFLGAFAQNQNFRTAFQYSEKGATTGLRGFKPHFSQSSLFSRGSAHFSRFSRGGIECTASVSPGFLSQLTQGIARQGDSGVSR